LGNARVLRQLSPGLKPSIASASKPDRTRMEAAIVAFLRAAKVNLADPNLRLTPRRVAKVWALEFLDGYLRSPDEALGETYPAPKGSSGELVVVTHLRFHSTCPHHLLPYQGMAHVAYAPAQVVVGFGQLSALIDCFAHRLILQEELARQVARALVRVLGSPSAACVIDAEQACLRLRGHRQSEAHTHVEAYEGRLRSSRVLRAEFWTRIRGAG